MGEMIFLVVIILLLFGGKKLPELARGLGAGIHEFRRGMNAGNEPTTATPHEVERDVTPGPADPVPARSKALPTPKARAARPKPKKKAAAKKKK